MVRQDLGARDHLARRMRLWRAQWELTQAQAADEAGISLRTWQRWERAETHAQYRDWQRMMMLMEQAPPSMRPRLVEFVR